MISLDIVHNISLLVSLCLVQGLLMRTLRHRVAIYPVLSGLLFGGVAILGMMTPMRWAPGVIFDGRSIILGIAGLFGGPLVGGLAALMAALYRMHLGGAGALMGVSVVMESVLVGVLAHLLARRWPWLLKSSGLYVQGFLIHGIMVLMMTLLPGGLSRDAFVQVGGSVVLVYPLGFMLVGRLFVELQEHFRTEEALRDSEARNRALLQAMPDLMFLFSRDGRILDFQSPTSEVLFVPPTAFLGKPLEASIPSELAETTRRTIARVLESGEPATFDYSLDMGEPRHYESRMVPCGPDACLAIVRDVTEREHFQQRLRDSRALYEDLIANNLAGFYRVRETIDPDAVGGVPPPAYEFLSDRYCELTALPREVHLQDPGALFEAIHPEDRESWFVRNREALETGEPFSWVGRLRGPDGDRWLHFESRSRLGDNGDRVWTGIVLDVTDRMRAEAEQQEMERRMLHVQKLESLGVLAGGMAHDFNNILTAILGHADLAMAKLDPGSPALEGLQAIEASARRASDLSRQMLAYSGRGRFVIEPIHLSDLVAEMVQLLKASISKKAVLDLRLASDLPTVEGDATQIRQVLMNLLTNASEAIGEPGGTITVRTARERIEEDGRARECVLLEVVDTGCGMDEATLARVYDPFFTTKFTGRGLGMAAVQGIVRSHHGLIRVQSAPGQGTTWHILLPAMEDALTSIPEPPKDFSGIWKGKGRILLVDDEADLRSVGSEMLRIMGFEVLTAAHGREALEIFRREGAGIDLVMLDLTMPEMDGEEAFRELRGMDPDVRVILSSGFTEQEVTARFVGQGRVGFLQKPYRLKDLAAAVRSALGRPDPA